MDWLDSVLSITKLFFLFIFAVISELIHYSAAGSSGGGDANMPLIQVIVPQIMSLKAQLADSSKVCFFLFTGAIWISII